MATKAKAKKSPPASSLGDDLEDFVVPKASNSQLAEIGDLCGEVIRLQDSIDNLTNAIAGYKKELLTITADKLPAAMIAARTNSFTTTDGVEIGLKDVLSGSIPKEDLVARAEAIKWIKSSGAKDLIKTKLEAAFNTGDVKTVAAAKTALKALKVPFNIKEDIHPQTLYAYVRGRLEHGQDVPLDLLGLYSAKHAIIKQPDKADTAPTVKGKKK